jgi:hypothetical protein
MRIINEETSEMLRDFVRSLTGEEPVILSDTYSDDAPCCIEIPKWTNNLRILYDTFEKDVEFAHIYSISAYGMRIRLYISDLKMSIKELMQDEELQEALENNTLTYKDLKKPSEDLSIFEQSMVII